MLTCRSHKKSMESYATLMLKRRETTNVKVQVWQVAHTTQFTISVHQSLPCAR